MLQLVNLMLFINVEKVFVGKLSILQWSKCSDTWFWLPWLVSAVKHKKKTSYGLLQTNFYLAYKNYHSFNGKFTGIIMICKVLFNFVCFIMKTNYSTRMKSQVREFLQYMQTR